MNDAHPGTGREPRRGLPDSKHPEPKRRPGGAIVLDEDRPAAAAGYALGGLWAEAVRAAGAPPGFEYLGVDDAGLVYWNDSSGSTHCRRVAECAEDLRRGTAEVEPLFAWFRWYLDTPAGEELAARIAERAWADLGRVAR